MNRLEKSVALREILEARAHLGERNVDTGCVELDIQLGEMSLPR